MKLLNENIVGDYAAYTAAAMQPGNSHFVYSTAPMRASTIQSFLEAHADKGVVFLSSETVANVEFWIAAPKKMCDAIHNSLRKWAFDAGHDIPEVQPERRGIFHAIMGMPAHNL